MNENFISNQWLNGSMGFVGLTGGQFFGLDKINK
jgi:hypothetical protein